MGYDGKLPGKNEVANLIIGALRQDKKDVVINAEVQAEIDQASFKAAEKQVEKLTKPQKVDVDTSKAEQKIKNLMEPLKAVQKTIQEISNSGADFGVTHNTISQYEKLKTTVSSIAKSIGLTSQELKDAQKIIRDIDDTIKGLNITVEKAPKKPRVKKPKIQKEVKQEVPVVSADHAPVVKAEKEKQEAIEKTKKETDEATEALRKQEKAAEDAAAAQKARLHEIYELAKANKNIGTKGNSPKDVDSLRQRINELNELLTKLKGLQSEVSQMDIQSDDANFKSAFATAGTLAKAIANKTRELENYNSQLETTIKLEEFAARSKEKYGITTRSKKFGSDIMDQFKQSIIGLQNGLSVDDAMQQLDKAMKNGTDALREQEKVAKAQEKLVATQNKLDEKNGVKASVQSYQELRNVLEECERLASQMEKHEKPGIIDVVESGAFKPLNTNYLINEEQYVSLITEAWNEYKKLEGSVESTDAALIKADKTVTSLAVSYARAHKELSAFNNEELETFTRGKYREYQNAKDKEQYEWGVYGTKTRANNELFSQMKIAREKLLYNNKGSKIFSDDAHNQLLDAINQIILHGGKANDVLDLMANLMGLTADKSNDAAAAIERTAEEQKKLDDLNKLKKNQEDWLRYLDDSLDESKFQSSGKRDATDKLRSRTAYLQSQRMDNYKYAGEYGKEKAEVAWAHAYQEAERQGVAQSVLNRYYTDAASNYDRNLKVLQDERAFRAQKLADVQKEIDLINKKTEAQKEFNQEKIKENIVYHAGDLSNISKTLKSFPLGNVPPTRSNGIGGLTGLYTTDDVDGFWGNEWHGAPISTIDLSGYKLLNARSNELAEKFGGFLSDLNATIYGYYEVIDEKDWELKQDANVKSVDELYKAHCELFKDSALTMEQFTQFINNAREKVSGKSFTDIEQPAIDEGIAKSGITRAMQDVAEDVFQSDSFKTQLLKMLGYEGVDLRGTKYNGTYSGGTVIFDVKPESIKTVNGKWSDVMSSHGYEIDEDDLKYEEKRRQLAFDTAKAYSQQADAAKEVVKNIEQSNNTSRTREREDQIEAYSFAAKNLLTSGYESIPTDVQSQLVAEFANKIAQDGMSASDAMDQLYISLENLRKQNQSMPDSVVEGWELGVQQLQDHVNALGEEFKSSEHYRDNFNVLVDGIKSGSITAAQAIEKMSDAYEVFSIDAIGPLDKPFEDALSNLPKLTSNEISNVFNSIDLSGFLKGLGIDESNFADFRVLFEDLMRITKAMNDGADVGAAFNYQIERIIDSIVRLGGYEVDFADVGLKDEMQEFQKYMSNKMIRYNDIIKADYTKDDWKASFGAKGRFKSKITKDPTKGMAPDELWEEITDNFPSLFGEHRTENRPQEQWKLIFSKLGDVIDLSKSGWKVGQGFSESDRGLITSSAATLYNDMASKLFASESADSMSVEADAARDVAQSMNDAAKAKEKFDSANQKVKKGADASSKSLNDEAESMEMVATAKAPDAEDWDTVTQYKVGDNDDPSVIRRSKTVRTDDSERRVTENLSVNEDGEWETTGSSQTDNYRKVREEELNALYKDRANCLTNIAKYTKEINDADTEAGRNAAREVLALEQDRLVTINDMIDAYGDLVNQNKLDAQDDNLVAKTRNYEQQRYIDLTEDEREEAVNAALQRRQSILNNIAKLEKQRNGASSDQEKDAINAIIATEQERARIVSREIDLYESVNAAQKVQQQDAKIIEKSRQQQQQQAIADAKSAAKEQKKLQNEQHSNIKSTYDEYLKAQKNIQKFNLDLSGKDHTDSMANEQEKLSQAQEKLLAMGVDVGKIAESDALTIEQKNELLEKELKHRQEIHDLIVKTSDQERDIQKAEATKSYKKSYNDESKALANIDTLTRALGEDNVGVSLQGKLESYKVLVKEMGNLYQQLDNSPGLADDEKFSNHYADVATKAKGVRKEIEDIFKSSQKLKKLGTPVAVGDQDVGKLQDAKSAMMSFADSSLDGEVAIKGFNKQGTEMYATVKDSTGELKNITVALDGTSGKLKAFETGASKATNEWKEFKDQISGGLKRAASMYLGFNDLIRYGREGVNYVKEIDLAMTELKKVTDETADSYKKFLENAGETSAVIGSTISDFTEATATFARLGYSMEESASMAETAIIYKNVADGLDSVEESSDSIISTMMAFGIQANDTMSIIDRFNAVGNNFAITSAGIGEALQRSASALYAAGNTIDESVALVTAANSVIQNPEQVGKMLADYKVA